jgi:hypothetical protein
MLKEHRIENKELYNQNLKWSLLIIVKENLKIFQ